ncbi:MAG: acetyltransferase [Ferruginibacter sp.]|nr:acetyltransferase [Ferruginibacter sp.]
MPKLGLISLKILNREDQAARLQNITMTNWIPFPTQLTGETVNLVPLEKEHFAQLETLAKDKRIWEFYAYDGSNPAIFQNIFTTALLEREKGTQFPFVIFHQPENRMIGSTRFLDIQSNHKKLEIGSTWLHPGYWATAVNLECKLLLLTYCFETLHAVRVQLKTDENNTRSRKAIEKIGGQFEGILRNDMIRDNNTRRNSAYYSIIEEEWKDKKSALEKLCQAKKNDNELTSKHVQR